jgi:hypothetical protein
MNKLNRIRTAVMFICFLAGIAISNLMHQSLEQEIMDHSIKLDIETFTKSLQCDCRVHHNNIIGIVGSDGGLIKLKVNVYEDAFGIKFIEVIK